MLKVGILLKTLYLTDLDGTFLNEKAEVSVKSAEIINHLIDNGCLFSVATARTFATVMKKFENVKLNIPLILMNGVLIFDPVKYKPICVHKIEKSAADEILDIFSQQNSTPMLYFENDGKIIIKHNTKPSNKHQSEYLCDRANLAGKILIKTEDISVQSDDNLIYIVSIDEYENSSPIHEKVKANKNVNCTYYCDNYTNAYFLETICKGISKASGAVMVKQILGVDKIVAFGDNLNDLPIFEIADESYAVSNACQELKDVATGIIGSNEDDSVAKFLLQRFQNGML